MLYYCRKENFKNFNQRHFANSIPIFLLMFEQFFLIQLGGTIVADITLICKDCGKEFVFTEGEQEFYKAQGFTNQPARCYACRKARKASRNHN